MMSIFESLENLNVSEECFNEICEDIIRAIDKKYDPKLEKAAKKGKKAFAKAIEKKWAVLDKATDAQEKELKMGAERANKEWPYASKEKIESIMRKNRTTNKNIEGEKKTNRNRLVKARHDDLNAPYNGKDPYTTVKHRQSAEKAKSPSSYKSIDIQHDSKYRY